MENNDLPALFSEKAFHKETIAMEDNNRTVTNNQELAEQFNTIFSKIIQNLKIDNKLVQITLNLYVFDPVLKAIKKYEKHHQNKQRR